jgi:hypothetical protein
LAVQYVENIYAKRQTRAAFERRILQLIDCKMVLETNAVNFQWLNGCEWHEAIARVEWMQAIALRGSVEGGGHD